MNLQATKCQADSAGEIRQLRPEETDQALSLAEEVFMRFEAPAWPPEGVATFRRDILGSSDFAAACRTGICVSYGAFRAGSLTAAVPESGHLRLALTAESWQRRGTQSAVFRCLLAGRRRRRPSQAMFTVSAAAGAVSFYRRLGFRALPPRAQDGIPFVPMELPL